MKEFIIHNKKSIIVFACAIVIIIACLITKEIVTASTDAEVLLRDGSSVGEVSAMEYDTHNANDLIDETASDVSDLSASSAVSSVAE